MANRHSILEPGNLLMVQERERVLARLLRRRGYTSLEGLRGFEAGCSTGYNLRLLVQWGARPEDLAGMDLDPAAVAYCRSRSPEIRVHEGSAASIPEPDGHFDLTLAYTLFSSIEDDETAEAVARELVRITRPGGLILVYDMRRRSTNPRVRPIAPRQIEAWFRGSRVRSASLTLAPPVARVVGRRAPWAYGALARLPFLRTHRLYRVSPEAPISG